MRTMSQEDLFILRYLNAKAQVAMQQNQTVMTNFRHFSLHQSPNNGGKKETQKTDYETGFEEMLKQGSVSEQQQKEFERRREEKAEEVRKAQEKLEQQREKSNQAKEQAFEDMLAGKKTQITDDMNL